MRTQAYFADLPNGAKFYGGACADTVYVKIDAATYAKADCTTIIRASARMMAVYVDAPKQEAPGDTGPNRRAVFNAKGCWLVSTSEAYFAVQADGPKRFTVVAKDDANNDVVVLDIPVSTLEAAVHIHNNPPRILTFNEPVTEPAPPKRDLCMAVNPSNPLQAIIISKGERGFHPFRMFRDEAATQDFVTRFNEREGLTPDQAEAWLIGSMFGWDVPGARGA